MHVRATHQLMKIIHLLKSLISCPQYETYETPHKWSQVFLSPTSMAKTDRAKQRRSQLWRQLRSNLRGHGLQKPCRIGRQHLWQPQKYFTKVPTRSGWHSPSNILSWASVLKFPNHHWTGRFFKIPATACPRQARHVHQGALNGILGAAAGAQGAAQRCSTKHLGHIRSLHNI